MLKRYLLWNEGWQIGPSPSGKGAYHLSGLKTEEPWEGRWKDDLVVVKCLTLSTFQVHKNTLIIIGLVGGGVIIVCMLIVFLKRKC